LVTRVSQILFCPHLLALEVVDPFDDTGQQKTDPNVEVALEAVTVRALTEEVPHLKKMNK
jgi:hypothetical protein